LILNFTSEINQELPWVDFNFSGYKDSFTGISDFSFLF
jgi:hypothetical protein